MDSIRNSENRFIVILYGLSFLSLLFGLIINSISYLEIESSIIIIIFLILIFFIEKTLVRSRIEKVFIYFLFSFYILLSSISSIYFNLLGNDVFNIPDAGNFYRWSAIHDWVGEYSFLDTLDSESRNFTEGGLSIYVWRFIYDFLHSLGFQKDHYIGILVNNLLMALSGVFFLKIVRHIYDNNFIKSKQFIILYSLAPLYWLYASIHIRDAFILFFISILTYVWVRAIKKNNYIWYTFALSTSLIMQFFFTYLRTEYILLPAMFISGAILAKVLSGSIYRLVTLSNGITALITITLFVTTTIFFYDTIFDTILLNYNNYLSVVATTASDSSLGRQLIVEIPFLIRVIVGPIYLLLYPIPFWSGFQLDSAYYLFKSFHAIYMYLWIPLLVVSLYNFYFLQKKKTSENLFLLILFVLFTIAVALTSLETRHFGNFFICGLIFSLIGFERNMRKIYNLFLITLLLGVMLIHIVWAILKFL